jgi:hypothetical protein
VNCKPGDLAVVVRSTVPQNLGRVFRVTRFVGQVNGWEGEDRWAIDADRPLIGVRGGRSWSARDSNLRPIRDPGEDAKDETLQWKEVPTKQKEPA